MVVYIRGTEESRNSAYSLAALLAGEGAIKYNRKTLILPFDYDRDIEQYFIGKYLKEITIDDFSSAFEDEGIDALFRRIEQRITKEIFTSCTINVFDGNLLDIAQKTRKTSLVDEIIKNYEDPKEDNYVETLIKFANDVYDDIFLISKGYNEKYIEILNKAADVSLISIKQINKENVLSPHEKLIYVVNEYDKNSVFNMRYMAKMYSIRNIVVMPYNAEFKDSYNLGRLISYIGKNQKIDKDDINYALFASCDGLLEKMYNDLNVEIEDEEDVIEVEEPEEETEDIESLDERFEPEYETVQLKKESQLVASPPTFKKRKKKKEFDFDNDEITYEEEDYGAFQEEEMTEVEPPKKKSKKKLSLFKKKAKEEPEYTDDYEDASDYGDDSENMYEEPDEPAPRPKKRRKKANSATINEDVNGSSATVSSDKSRRRKKKVEITEDILEEAPAPKKSRRRKNKQDSLQAIPVGKEETVLVPGNGEPIKSWRCPECGTLNKNNFCSGCGYKRPMAKPKKKWECPECGNINEGEAKFCESCGAKKPAKQR